MRFIQILRQCDLFKTVSRHVSRHVLRHAHGLAHFGPPQKYNMLAAPCSTCAQDYRCFKCCVAWGEKLPSQPVVPVPRRAREHRRMTLSDESPVEHAPVPLKTPVKSRQVRPPLSGTWVWCQCAFFGCSVRQRMCDSPTLSWCFAHTLPDQSDNDHFTNFQKWFSQAAHV